MWSMTCKIKKGTQCDELKCHSHVTPINIRYNLPLPLPPAQSLESLCLKEKNTNNANANSLKHGKMVRKTCSIKKKPAQASPMIFSYHILPQLVSEMHS
ncbi:hypothetical protein AX774_g208 [Zancudomyces culisetae]|uniref:Uncharacterized protein n=1 Tax=Zancudomyces culisetae TaxID=1213189 RepID=A0A1R1PZF1_ZANCU|nr:hypothetical protein AX774_g208 [Zancudomyces culisetae]|eukprot:OMH86316.1 hypothetical protein AX774_g208 [Zancudomyces culisetae]